MGYSTDFQGHLTISPQISQQDADFIRRFACTRHMKRDISLLAKLLKITEDSARNLYGPEGEFFIGEAVKDGEVKDGCEESIIDYNNPPDNQPGLWCQWTVENSYLVWDGCEKFHNYIEWLKYLIDAVFTPRGYTLNGNMLWIGEDPDDRGTILVINNVVTIDKIIDASVCDMMYI